VITVSSEGNNMDEALAQIDKISIYKGLSPKDTITLRLLTEEVAGNPNLSARFGFFVLTVIPGAFPCCHPERSRWRS
jgi:hypothetical protein